MADSSEENQKEDCKDIISLLPDHLLCKILSFLNIEEAAITSILSTRWRHLFASVPNITLDFLPKEELDQELSRLCQFINFGNGLFRQRKGLSITKFQIGFLPFQNIPEECRSSIEAWVYEAISCKVQQLVIFSWKRGSLITEHTIRSTILTCTTLVSLRLINVQHVRLKGIRLPLLKELRLDVFLDDEDSLSELFKGCPLLEQVNLDVGSNNDVSKQLSRSGMFQCERLVTLCLLLRYTPFVDFPDSVFLPNLKALYIQRFKLSPNKGGNSLQTFINSCPALEEIHINDFCFPDYPNETRHIGISSPKLKFLLLTILDNLMLERDAYTVVIESTNLECLVYDGQGEKNDLIVNAPNLRYFDYTGDLQKIQFREGFRLPFNAIISVENSSKARTEHYSPRVQLAFELVSDLKDAKSLRLSDTTLEALYHSLYPLPIFKNLISLKLDVREHLNISKVKCKRWWKMLPRLFARAPNLEVLVMERVFWQNWKPDEEFVSFEHLLHVNFPVRFVGRLREIKILDFVPVDDEIYAVKYILQNGKALERFTISGHAFLWRPYSVLDISNKILAFEKCSEDCKIVFECLKPVSTSENVYDRLVFEGVKTAFTFDSY